jgi:truncated hemoglobin YjbI
MCAADTDSVHSNRTGTSNLANSDSVSLKKIVDTFYERVLQHDELKPFFAHMSESDMAKLRRHQVRLSKELAKGEVLGRGKRFSERQLGRLGAKKGLLRF